MDLFEPSPASILDCSSVCTDASSQILDGVIFSAHKFIAYNATALIIPSKYSQLADDQLRFQYQVHIPLKPNDSTIPKGVITASSVVQLVLKGSLCAIFKCPLALFTITLSMSMRECVW